MMNSQINTFTLSDSETSADEARVCKSYTIRLDFITESQIDDIIRSGALGLDKLCPYSMGCLQRKDIILKKEGRIQLFTDTRIKNIELIKVESSKKTSIAVSVSNTVESYITATQQIT